MTSVLILCGGRGARFNDETERVPKPLIEVAGKPMLGHIMDLFEIQGFDEFLIAGGYRWGQLSAYLSTRYQCRAALEPDLHGFGNKSDKMRCFLGDTGESAGTAERVGWFMDHCFMARPFFITYGDGLCDVDLDALLKYHMAWSKLSNGTYPSLTLTAVRQPSRFGLIELGDSDGGIVRDFSEKPAEGWINGGFMVCDPFIDDSLAAGKFIGSLETETMPELASLGRLRALRHEGYWRCMDTRRDLEQIEDDVRKLDGKFPWSRSDRSGA